MTSRMVEYIAKSSDASQRSMKQYKIYGNVDFYIIHPLPENVDVRKVISSVQSKVPHKLINNVDAFYVAHLKEFDEKSVNAMYRDGAIYITNQQEDVEDMVEDIIHELAHAIEESHAERLYEDGKIQSEFLGKRTRLHDLLQQYKYITNPRLDFTDLEYSQDLDHFFHEEIGYDVLENFCMGLFVRPYSCTDIREYFATAFEEYVLGDRAYVKKVCPITFSKLSLLLK